MDKDYAARKWVTADEKLTGQPCELIYASAVSDGGEIKDTLIYDGESTSGELLYNFQSGDHGNEPLSPPEPIICHRGIYVDIGSSTEGVFVMWRNLPRKG